jgi:hypothetical protein
VNVPPVGGEWSHRGLGELSLEDAGHRCLCGHEIPIHDDMTSRHREVDEGVAHRRPQALERGEVHVPVRAVEDEVVREVGVQGGVVLGGDPLLADADESPDDLLTILVPWTIRRMATVSPSWAASCSIATASGSPAKNCRIVSA